MIEKAKFKTQSSKILLGSAAVAPFNRVTARAKLSVAQRQ
jgi:hypothetical protein